MTEEKQKVIGVLKSLIEFLEDDGGDSSLPLRGAQKDSQAAGAEEARIMTQDEIIGWDGYIWFEFSGMRAMKVVLIDHGMVREPFRGDYPTKELSWGNYQEKWRAWTGLPTEEQRKAEAWEE